MTSQLNYHLARAHQAELARQAERVGQERDALGAAPGGQERRPARRLMVRLLRLRRPVEASAPSR